MLYAGLCFSLAAGAFWFFGWRRLTLATGYAAKNACSAVFVAGRKPESVAAGENDINTVRLARVKIDQQAKTATAALFGLKPRIAVYREGLGCTLLPEGAKAAPPLPAPRRAPAPAGETWPYGAEEPAASTALARAVAAAFDAPGENLKKTAAVIVLRDGRLAAEHYAPGFSRGTRLAGWSMTKSLTGAVYGAYKLKHGLDLGQANLFPKWKDGRAAITLDSLLRMSSGLAWTEDYGNISDATSMLFNSGDVAAAALRSQLESAPGSKWYYSSGTSNLLSAWLRGRFATQQEYLDFWYAALADRIGMRSLLLETDPAGNYVGSSFSWATARDWARFGQLFLDGGVWNGLRVLDAGWAKYTAAPAPASGGAYGAQFWLNAAGKFPSAPADMYYCGGYQGQYIFIIPSRRAVIVRLGLGEKPHFSADLFLKEVLSAL
jgi:CubicO group peptidase (beta-lactamase class C family)